jgi:hypothetical protein
MAETWETLAAEHERLLDEQRQLDATEYVFQNQESGFANFPS